GGGAAFGGGGRHSLPQADRGGAGGGGTAGRPHGREAARRGDRHRPPHRREIPRGDEDPVLGATSAREAGCPRWLSAPLRCRNASLGHVLAHVPAKWTPVRRQEH